MMWLQMITLDDLFDSWQDYNQKWGKAMTFGYYYDAVKASGWIIL